MFGLVIACVCGVGILSFSFFLLVTHSASTNWAQWLWFSAATLGCFSVDAYAVQCLSGEEGDIIHSYLRGFFRSTSRQDEVEDGDEENPVVEEEVVASPIHPNDVSIEMIDTERLASPRPVSARSVGSGSSKKVVTGPRRRKQKGNVKEVDDVAVEIENGDEENPVTEEESSSTRRSLK